MAKANGESVPQALLAVYETLTAGTNAICAAALNAEYAALARKMTAALARKRPSPLLSGKPATWVCGILYTLGRVNFLFDQSQTPHLRAEALCALCGVGKSTGGTKAKAIEDALNIQLFDATWTLPSRLESSPMIWLVQVNGLIVDVRGMPRPIQEEAFRKGIIPYIPADGPPRPD